MRTQAYRIVCGIAPLILTFSLYATTNSKANSDAAPPTPSQKTVALTIDDLPFVGSTQNHPRKLARENKRLLRLMSAVQQQHIPTVGFVISGTIEQGQWEMLEQFHQQGLVIANHTHNHLNLNRTPADKFIANIDKAQKKLAPLMTEDRKFFRYPYLAEGRGQRRETVRQYLAEQQFVIAPVTIDSHDFRYNQSLYRIPYRVRKHKQNLTNFKNRYLSHIWYQTLRAERNAQRIGQPDATQILLLHANLVNSLFLDDIIKMYQNKGYRFVSLDQALPPAPETKPTITNS